MASEYPGLGHIRKGATAETRYLLGIVDTLYQELVEKRQEVDRSVVEMQEAQKELEHLQYLYGKQVYPKDQELAQAQQQNEQWEKAHDFMRKTAERHAGTIVALQEENAQARALLEELLDDLASAEHEDSPLRVTGYLRETMKKARAYLAPKGDQ